MITDSEYQALRAKIDTFDTAIRSRYGDGWISYKTEDVADIAAPTNAERSLVEVYEFCANPPERYFAYIQEDDGKPSIMTTWTGEKLGDVFFASPWRDNFGGVRFPITVKAINGKEYYGTYYKSSGDYCRIKMRKEVKNG